ncbi:MAG: hypothetical protein ACRD21_08630 [Vicinamibacteria bacterium]
MAVTRLAALLLLTVAPLAGARQAAAPSEEPTIDHQPVECSSLKKNARICAYVLDDGEVKRVRAYFRAEKQEAFYWSDMAFDGIQFCATLPVAKEHVDAIEYYIWAVDDQVQVSRTRSYPISLSPTAPCAYPVVDEDRARISNLVVNATSEKQGAGLEEFEKLGVVQFVSLKKK